MKKILIIISPILFFIVVFLFWWLDFLTPLDKNQKETKIFVISPGQGINSIASGLCEEKLIKNPFLFKILVQYLGIGGKIQAGDFRLSGAMGAKEIASNLTHGTLDVWVTIPEGLRNEEIAVILENKIKIDKNDFLIQAKDYQGFLFPDTYLIPKEADNRMILNIFLDNFQKKSKEIIDYQKAERGEIKYNGLDLKEVLTLASLIEREARHDQDRFKIAGVLYNRINIGMKLDIDATVQYAASSINCQNQKNCQYWPKNLTSDDLKINSSYNTYLNPGLPPGPICNPGLLAIKAAINPDNHDFLYYLSDENGNNYYAKTLQEHNININKYIY